MTTQQEIYEFLKSKFPPIPKWMELDGGNHETFYPKHPEYPDHPAEKILLCVTSSCKLEEYAEENGYDLIVAHHPIRCHYGSSMYFHTSMDFAKDMSQNIYFAKALNLQNVKLLGDSYVFGELSNEMKFKDFHKYLGKCGYKIRERLEWHISDKLIKTVCFVSGAGSYAFSDSWKGTERPTLHDVEADIFVTGELWHTPKFHKFSHILEIGHTNSEKPIFNWIKEILMQKFKNLQVDIVDDKLEGWGD